MSYSILATSDAPALVIYLLDVSSSMINMLGSERRIDVVANAYEAALRGMVAKSTKGRTIASRYRIALFAYSDNVYDLYQGIKTVGEAAKLGVPELPVFRTTETAKAFREVELLLQNELPHIQHCPPPLVCHMTDGQITGPNPEPIVRRIMQMSTSDGNVLVENIFISDRILREPIQDPRSWQGILPNTPLISKDAEKLRSMSSVMPDNYRVMTMLEEGFNIADGALMMLPGTHPELVELGFVMAIGTGYGLGA